ncbi:MAG: FadR family transcriptional regulator [Clostridiales bacterium]|nr:FadR family transcriptional regulator [Clostridiales bacterium]MDO4349131.1 FadR/GntR family transcriptional regulator [Eubacteriales bacterium]MDY4007882.1 FadR/GntR family transcriptional regulator [Candidatus Limiplasma sp.]
MGTQAKTLVERTAETLIAFIHDQALQPGDKLPTEAALCASLGVGRNTLREALKILASRNIVFIRQGAGAFVTEKPGVVEDPLGFALISDREKLTHDLMQVRAMLEPPIAALAAQCATQAEIAQLEAILAEMESAIREQKSFSALDMAYHRKIAECTHNTVMENLIPVIVNGVSVFAQEVGTPEYEQTLLSHRRIFELIQSHQPFEAEMAMRFHILYNQNRYEEMQKKMQR